MKTATKRILVVDNQVDITRLLKRGLEQTEDYVVREENDAKAALSAAEENELWTFIMLRRMTLFAWIGSHAATDLARTEGRAYSFHTCELAERYLGRFA